MGVRASGCRRACASERVGGSALLGAVLGWASVAWISWALWLSVFFVTWVVPAERHGVFCKAISYSNIP